MTALLRTTRLKTTPKLIILLFLATFAMFYFINIDEQPSYLTFGENYSIVSEQNIFLARLQSILRSSERNGPVTSKENKLLVSSLLDSSSNTFTETDKNISLQAVWKGYVFSKLDISEKEFKPKLNPNEKLVLYETFAKLDSICQKLQFTCMLYSGTLLGSWRHHDIIPWDGDADIMSNSTEKDELFSALSMLSPSYEIINTGTRFKFYSRKATKTTKHPWKWPYIDIWFFKENDTHIWDEVPTKAFMRDYVYPKHLIFPTHRRPFGKVTFDAPYDTFAVLNITYKTTDCETHFYDHKYEKFQRDMFKTLPCYTFRNEVGFVYRVKTTSGLLEILIKGNVIFNIIHTKEPVYAISDPFNLTLLQ